MKVLYLDNIRGFKNSVIPIRDVTFLVGDNSSGKSTVMSLLHFLSSVPLFEEHDFDSDDYHLGGFRDLISHNGRGRGRFTLGLSERRWISSGDYSNTLFFLSYESDEGLPKPTRFSYLVGDLFVSVRMTKKVCSWRVLKIPDVPDENSEIECGLVEKTAHLHNTPSSAGFKKITESRFFHMPNEIMYAGFFQVPELMKDSKSFPQDIAPYQHYQGSRDPSVWIAPIRAKPKRTYDDTRARFDSEGTHVPYVIRREFNNKKKNSKFRKMIASFGIDGHLFDDLSVQTFGSNDYGPFEVKVSFGEERLSIANVGYGVSQVLPIIIEGLDQPAASNLFIQQPEVHLHPRAQAAVGSLLWQLSLSEKKKFCIETHSDYTIDRFRLEMSKSESTLDSSLLFFKRTKEGNTAVEIRINENGHYSADQPPEFREFFIREQMQLISI